MSFDRDPEVPEADAAEQDATAAPEPDVPIDVPEADALEDRPDRAAAEVPSIPVDVPEADALEQARDAGLDENDYRP
jgi:hypothetical protein